MKDKLLATRGARSILTLLIALCTLMTPLQAQNSIFGKTIGDPVPPEVEKMYRKGLAYLVKNQRPDGSWPDSYGREPGVVGLSILAMLAHGDDPDHGTYARPIRRAVSFIIKSQNKGTGMIGGSMYNHGFATLALAEAYGAVGDDRLGPALEKAVRLLLTSQKNNPFGAWRYYPTGRDADTTAAGACMVALYAARNAGVHVPQAAIDKGLAYYKRCQSGDGGFGYTNPGGSNAPRTAIGCLCFALGRKKKSQVGKRSLNYLKTNGYNGGGYYYYYIYYMPQALFQSDIAYWKKWNAINIRSLAGKQSSSGAWSGSHGAVFSTSSALLSLALNYRFLPIYER